MRPFGRRRRNNIVALSPLLLAGLLVSCASRHGTPDDQTGQTPAQDVRLLGVWHVDTIQATGHEPQHADSATTAALRFRRDGLLIINGERCGAPHFSASANRLQLHWPHRSVCNDASNGTPLSFHIAVDLESLVSHAPITYGIQEGAVLRVFAGGYRAKLLRGPVRLFRRAAGK